MDRLLIRLHACHSNQSGILQKCMKLSTDTFFHFLAILQIIIETFTQEFTSIKIITLLGQYNSVEYISSTLMNYQDNQIFIPDNYLVQAGRKKKNDFYIPYLPFCNLLTQSVQKCNPHTFLCSSLYHACTFSRAHPFLQQSQQTYK